MRAAYLCLGAGVLIAIAGFPIAAIFTLAGGLLCSLASRI